MLDVVLAVTDFASVGEFTFRSLTGAGTFTTATVRRTGEESVTVPAGTFDMWRLAVKGEQTVEVVLKSAE